MDTSDRILINNLIQSAVCETT